MVNNVGNVFEKFYKENIVEYFRTLQESPLKMITFIIDIAIVLFLLCYAIKIARGSRAWQLIKGIALLVLVTILSGLLNLKILNSILTGIMNWGVLAIIVIFQPELRRGLEQLGTNKLTRFFGIDKDVATKTKEDIYKIVIASSELSKKKTGALIVIERDIKIKDIIQNGVIMDSEVSPQLLVNIFEPNTPLHDGAVIISQNKIAAAACVLPLADDKDIAKELGTRHRAAIGISKESDSIVVIVSEETGKISVAKDGTLIADVREDVLKKILISNVITKRFATEKITRKKSIRNNKDNIDKSEE
ncbi:MAG: diadenylate cyclase CdaA [Clostridia bacterium]|nr:diadenylate cyclase CdaA [Clostridia bacterium]